MSQIQLFQELAPAQEQSDNKSRSPGLYNQTPCHLLLLFSCEVTSDCLQSRGLALTPGHGSTHQSVATALESSGL